MRKYICAPMITLCLLLNSCSDMGEMSADQAALDMRASYLEMTTCEAILELTADYGQRVYTYTLDLNYQKDGETTVCIIEPQEVAGITARISESGTTLEYDGMSVETGPMDDQGLSPVSAVPVLLDTITQGFIAETCIEENSEGNILVITCREPDTQAGVGREVILQFDANSYAFLQGEILSDGYRVIDCTVNEFIMTGLSE